jgi:hypothetical protein
LRRAGERPSCASKIIDPSARIQANFVEDAMTKHLTVSLATPLLASVGHAARCARLPKVQPEGRGDSGRTGTPEYASADEQLV